MSGQPSSIAITPSSGFIIVKPVKINLNAVNGFFIKDTIPELQTGEVIASPQCEGRKNESDRKCLSFPIGTKIVYKRLLGKVGELCVVEADDVIGALKAN